MSAAPLSKGDQQRATRYAAVTAEIAKLEGELQGHDCEAMVKKHIAALNEYNEGKDACSVLIGKIANLEGTTVAEIYKKLGLQLDD